MGMVVSAAVTGIPLIEHLEQPYNPAKKKLASPEKKLVEVEPPVAKKYIPPSEDHLSTKNLPKKKAKMQATITVKKPVAPPAKKIVKKK